MDLIYTNIRRFDQGVLSAYAFDLSYGASENDFEVTIGVNEATLDPCAFVYMEGTEYGGMIDGLKASTNSETITYMGRTWHGILNGKVIQPDTGKDYLVVSGDANEVLSFVLDRLDVPTFAAAAELSGIYISSYQFPRYCKAYDGIKAMLAAFGAKLKIAWHNRHVVLSAEPIVDYTDSPVDGDIASFSVERHTLKVSHLICLGKGDLAEREVIHLYDHGDGGIGDFKLANGMFEIVEIYENSNSEDLRSDGIAKFTELLNTDKSEISIPEIEGLTYDIGDIVGATERKTGISVAAPVTQKIVKIINGVVSTEYKTGG